MGLWDRHKGAEPAPWAQPNLKTPALRRGKSHRREAKSGGEAVAEVSNSTQSTEGG